MRNTTDSNEHDSQTHQNHQKRQHQQKMEQQQQIKLGRGDLLTTTTKKKGEGLESREKIKKNRVGFTYELQRPKKIASAVNLAERSDQIRSGSLTYYNDQRRQRQPSMQQRNQIKSGRVHIQTTKTKEDSNSGKSSR